MNTPKFEAAPFSATKPGDVLYVLHHLGTPKCEPRLAIRAYFNRPSGAVAALVFIKPTPEGYPVVVPFDQVSTDVLRSREAIEFIVEPAAGLVLGNEANAHIPGSLLLIGSEWFMTVTRSKGVPDEPHYLNLQTFEVTSGESSGPRVAFRNWRIKAQVSGTELYAPGKPPEQMIKLRQLASMGT